MRIRTLDLRGTDGSPASEFGVLRNVLIRDGKYLPSPQLLYRGFDAENIPSLLKNGQDNLKKFIFCAAEEEITEEYPTGETNIFEYAHRHKEPAIAVFSAEQLIELDNNPLGAYAYGFRNPNKKLEALVAVYRLKY